MPYTQEIKDKLRELYLQKSDDCTSIGYGFKEKDGRLTEEKSIIFSFKEKKPLSELTQEEIVPDYITISDQNIKTDVVQGEDFLLAYVACPTSFYSWSSDSSLNPTGRTTPPQQFQQRPLKGGLEIGNQTSTSVGTMGFIAVDKATNSLVGVTNGHVICDIFFGATESGRSVYSVFNNDIAQDGGSSTNLRIGVAKRYVPIYSLPYENYVDGALITLDSSSVDLSQAGLYFGFSFTDPPPFATSEEIDDLIDNNWDFYSVGRTTGAKGQGETKLKFLSYNIVSVANDITFKTSRETKFYDCISYIASASTTSSGNSCFWPINAGDSGSALLANINGTVKIIGLSFAGSTAGTNKYVIARACRIDKVAEQLNIEAFTGQTVNFSDKTNPQFHYEMGASPLSAITINGNKYYQVGTTS